MTLPGGPRTSSATATRSGGRSRSAWDCLGGGTDTIRIEAPGAEKAQLTDVYGMEEDFKAEVEAAFDGMIEQEVSEEGECAVKMEAATDQILWPDTAEVDRQDHLNRTDVRN